MLLTKIRCCYGCPRHRQAHALIAHLWFMYNHRMIRRLFLIFTVIIVAAKFSNESQAQNSTSDDSEILFVRRIAPLLREKCLGCHGNDPQEIEGSLDVRSLAGLLTGGDSNEPSIVAGKPDKSP